MKRALLLLAVAGAIVALFATNPTMDQFKDFVQDRSEQILLQETGDTRLGRILSDLGSGLAGGLVDRITERNNYGLFSTYAIGGTRDDPDAEAWRFVGIAGQFFELERPESINLETR